MRSHLRSATPCWRHAPFSSPHHCESGGMFPAGSPCLCHGRTRNSPPVNGHKPAGIKRVSRGFQWRKFVFSSSVCASVVCPAHELCHINCNKKKWLILTFLMWADCWLEVKQTLKCQYLSCDLLFSKCAVEVCWVCCVTQWHEYQRWSQSLGRTK